MIKNENITACIIAGGKSKRFGSDKALFEYKGQPLISHVHNTLKEVFDDIVIIGGSKAKYGFLGLEIYEDIIPELGPIGGLYTAFSTLKTQYIFVIACDMPFVTPDLIKIIIDKKNNYDIVIPQKGDYTEPLCAIYKESCKTHIKDMIDQNNLKIKSFFNKMKVHEINQKEISDLGNWQTFFHNINYLEDIENENF